MKAESFRIVSDLIKSNVVSRIIELETDGKVEVVIRNSGKKSERQRGLQWAWNTDVSLAGIGGKHEDTKNGVHLVSKYRWALPILTRDDPDFSLLYSMWLEKHGQDEERMLWFIDTQVHTESMTTSQMAEYLTDFQRYYGGMVNLSHPDDMNLLRG